MKLFMNSKRIEDAYGYEYFIFIQEKHNENKMCIISSFLRSASFRFSNRDETSKSRYRRLSKN